MNKLLKYKDLHKGETIFIIGAGYGLNELSEEEINSIQSNYISIGCNQSYLKIKSNYYISGHFHHMIMQYHYGGDNAKYIFQGEPQDFFPNNNYNIDILTDINIVGHPGWLPKPNETKSVPLVGAEQIGFSATHLAYILGAKKIVYVGFDFSARGHFYNKNTDIINQLKIYSEEIKTKYIGINSFIDEDITDFFTFNFSDQINNEPFRKHSEVMSKFGSYINSLHNEDIETYTLHDCFLNSSYNSKKYKL